jgi:hypothetical protein
MKPVVLALTLGCFWTFGVMAPAMAQSTDTNFSLLTEEETIAYKQYPIADDEGSDTRSLKLTVNDGPTIEVASPSGFTLRSPVNFDIRIKPRGAVPVSMSSLKIEYRLGPIWTDITARLAGHGAVIGTQLKARGADLPVGNHRVRLTVLDTAGKKTSAVLSFAVVN